MSVKLHFHKSHRQYTAGLETVVIEGETVGECLHALIALHPAMEAALFKDSGELQNQIEIYLNMESAYPDELIKKTKNGDEIHITIMLAGG